MGLKYNASGKTYDLSGPQYTDIRGTKRLNYIASGKTYQLGLSTDKTCSQYSPLVMRINGTNHYIGRSTSTSGSSSSYSTNRIISTYTSIVESGILIKTYNNNKFLLYSQCLSYTNVTGEDPFLPETRTSFSRYYGKSSSYTTTKPPEDINKLTYCDFGQEGLYVTYGSYLESDNDQSDYAIEGTFYGTTDMVTGTYTGWDANGITRTAYKGFSTQIIYVDYTGSTSSSQYTSYKTSTSSSYKTCTVSTSLATSTSSHNFV